MGIELYPKSTSLVFWRCCRPLWRQLELNGANSVLTIMYLLCMESTSAGQCSAVSVASWSGLGAYEIDRFQKTGTATQEPQTARRQLTISPY